MSGNDPDDEELEEVEELERLTSLKDQSLWTKLKKCVLDLVERVGFFGILVCASVSSRSSSFANGCGKRCIKKFRILTWWANT